MRLMRPIPPSPQSKDTPSPILPAQSPRFRSGRDSGHDARKCGSRDSHATA